MNNNKLRLAIDMDDVMADTHAKLLMRFHQDYGTPLDLALKPGSEIFENLPSDIAGRWTTYINEEGFFRDVPVMEGAQEVIQELHQKYDLFVVSAALQFRNSLIDKYDWLQEYFPYISWTHILFTGHKIVVSDLMIDDRAKNFSPHITRPLLFSSPHNVLLSGYERVDNWQEVAQKLL